MIKLVSKEWIIENVKTVLFDKDGTFLDLHYFWGKMTEMRAKEVIKIFCLSESHFAPICEVLGYDVISKKMYSDGITALYSRVKIIEIFVEKLRDFQVFTTDAEIVEIFDSVSEEFYKKINEYTKPIDGAIEFIKELHSKGAKLGIVTSDSVESTYITLKNFGWEYLFDVVIGRESSNETKESGVPTRIALDKLNAKLDSTIMIGDAPMDLISAQNAGITRTVLVATGQVGVNELKMHSPFVLESLGDLECLKI